MTGEVRLRDVELSDLPIFFEQQKEPQANRMAAIPAREQGPFTAHWRKILTDESNIIQTITCDGRVAGNVVSFEQDGMREVGYWLGVDYWGKGIATQALTEFLKKIDARPLYGHVARHNIASRRVLEKCGFEVIGEDESPFSPGGEPVDEYIMVLRAGEDEPG